MLVCVDEPMGAGVGSESGASQERDVQLICNNNARKTTVISRVGLDVVFMIIETPFSLDGFVGTAAGRRFEDLGRGFEAEFEVRVREGRRDVAAAVTLAEYVDAALDGVGGASRVQRLAKAAGACEGCEVHSVSDARPQDPLEIPLFVDSERFRLGSCTELAVPGGCLLCQEIVLESTKRQNNEPETTQCDEQRQKIPSMSMSTSSLLLYVPG